MTYDKSAAGMQAFKTRSPLLSARQRAMFILFDGKRATAEVLDAVVGMQGTTDDLDHLLKHGLLVPVSDKAAPGAPGSSEWVSAEGAVAERSQRTDQERYLQAKLLATALTASLGLRGFKLNLAVESAAGYDQLLKLLPKLQEAAGLQACRELERALLG